jgi:hypothetical protein
VAARDLDDEPEETPLGAPLPKDDRLWRHPSELADPATVTPVHEPSETPRRASRWRFKRHS